MSQKLIPISLLVALVAMFAMWSLLRHRELHVHPAGNVPYSLFSYTDIPDKGTSECSAESRDGRLILSYVLHSGFAYPYVGMGLDFTQRDSTQNQVSFLDLEGYDSVRVKIRSARSNDLRLQIVTNDPNLSRPGSALSMRYLVQTISVERGWSTMSLPLSSFTIPDWWYQANHLQPDPTNRYLARTAQINFQNGQGIPLDVQDTIEIEELTFVGENRAIGWIFAGIAILLLLAFGIHSWTSRERLRAEHSAQIAHRREELLSQAEKLPLNSHRTEDSKRILEYIGKNYTDSELDLERVCHETGVNRNRLTAILKEEVGTTFKGHLTDLRLSEATRALSETDLQVTEIAYKVGFGNVSHFNRVFKERFDITPNEFRRNNQKPSQPHV